MQLCYLSKVTSRLVGGHVKVGSAWEEGVQWDGDPGRGNGALTQPQSWESMLVYSKIFR